MSDGDTDDEKLIPIEMPRLSSGAGEEDGESEGATLANWLVDVGDEVEQGEVIAELETDKATVELESPATGRLAEIAVEAGTEGLQPGARLGSIEGAGAPAADAAGDAAGDAEDATDAPDSSDVGDEARAGGSEASGAEGRGDDGAAESSGAKRSDSPGAEAAPGRATPLARRAAEANAVDLDAIEGSGPKGRVVEADVLRAAEGASDPAGARAGSAEAGDASRERAGAAASTEAADATEREARGASAEAGSADSGVRIERLSAMRKTIARRMTESKQQVPHFYLRARVAMDEVMAVRKRLNAGLVEEGASVKISLNDFVVRAVAGAMRDVPNANVQYAEDGMRIFERVDVSVAVATEGGLVTPVVRDADRKGLTALAEEVQALAAQARDGSLRPEQYQGGTVTISNLGMYGIETVYPILNPPQACIVGVGAAEAQPVVREGEIEVAHVAMVTLAADHRAVDGAVGAQLLAAIRARLEDPLGMML